MAWPHSMHSLASGSHGVDLARSPGQTATQARQKEDSMTCARRGAHAGSGGSQPEMTLSWDQRLGIHADALPSPTIHNMYDLYDLEERCLT
jgi:hypothetical protein